MEKFVASGLCVRGRLIQKMVSYVVFNRDRYQHVWQLSVKTEEGYYYYYLALIMALPLRLEKWNIKEQKQKFL